MRRLALLTVLLLAATTPARAALLWSETSDHGYPITHWAKGSSLEEVNNLTRAYVGDHSLTLMTCRQGGWFAYVGSNHDYGRGISCGFEARRAALTAARQQCNLDGGRCDIERVGFDDGKPVTATTPGELPVELTMGISASEPLQPLNDPIEYRHWNIFEHLFGE